MYMIQIEFKLLFLITGCIAFGDSFIYAQSPLKRNTISLNGTWQIAEGKNNLIPKNFNHTVQVPGLVSLASPSFINVGPKLKDRNSSFQYDSLREAFWYRRTFTVQRPIRPIAILKISKCLAQKSF